MSDSRSSNHADGALPSNVSEPTLAEKARTLTEQGGHSSLSTMSKKHPGYPFGSLMPYGLSSLGEPTFLISSMAMHTRNLLDSPRATLLITQLGHSGSALGAGRISLLGDVYPVESDEETRGIASRYLERNPEAQSWLNFGDFQFFRMSLCDVYYVGGFGVMGWIRPDDYLAANPDPLALIAAGVIQHMNEDHRDSLVLIVRQMRGINALDAEMTTVDRLGFNLRVNTPEGPRGERLSFPRPVEDSKDIRDVFVRMAKTARND